jgi:hypothetical protein
MNEQTSEKNNRPDDKTFKDHREFLLKSLYEQAKSFDKGILTLAASALALSLVFIQKISPSPDSWTIPFLMVSWCCFAVCILSTLISFLTSQAAHRQQIDEWDKKYKKSEDSKESDTYSTEPKCSQTKKLKNYGSITTYLNISSMILFVLGVFSFVVFAFINLPTGQN